MSDKKKLTPLTLGSLFDGSGGFPLAGILAGIKPVWASEVSSFPILVTQKRLPQVKHYGDVSKLKGSELEPVDIITFGSPCQDLSIAGKRAGLAGERSGLYMQAVRIIKEMLEATNREYPKFCVFENVPGLLSSNQGNDFVACLDMLQELGFIPDVNILDAQYMGVPQRRKRVFITWLNVDYILSRKTNISDCIILQLFTEILLLRLGELLKVLGTEQKNLDVNELSRCEDGLKKRIKLFSLQEESRFLKLLANLTEIQAAYLKEPINSVLYHGADRTAECISTTKGTASDDLNTENQYGSIEQLLKKCLDENYFQEKLSTISTQTRETMLKEISMYFQALLNMLTATLHWTQSFKEETMFLNCFEWVQYCLIEIKENINAGKQCNKSIKDVEWDDVLRLFEQEISEIGESFERHFNEFCGQEILSKSQSLSGDSESCGFPWQRTAAGIETRAGSASGQFCVNPQGSSTLTITEEQTGTLVAQDHGNHPAVLQESFPVLGDQGGDVISVTDNVTCTLRAQSKHPPCVIDENNNDNNDNNNNDDNNIALNEWGDSRPNITNALRVRTSHVPCVMSAGFCTEHSSKARSIGYEEEKSPTLRAGVVPATLLFDNHAQEARYDGPLDTNPTITARYGSGGNNAPLVAQTEFTQENVDVKAFGICSNGSNGMKSNNPNVGFYEAQTSRTLDRAAVNPIAGQGGIAVVEAYNSVQNQAKKADVARALDCSIGHLSSRQGGTAVVNTDEPVKSDKAYEAEANETVETYDVRFTSEGTKNARGHCYKTDISRCLDTSDSNPDGNHGGICIVGFSVNQRDEVRDLRDCAGALQAQPGMKQQTFVLQGSMIGRNDKNGPLGDGVNEDVSFCLNTIDRHAIVTPAQGIQKKQEDKTYCSTVGSFMHAEEERANTLMARDYKDPQIVNVKQSNEQAYIVRRLTPTECARLQGFPDWWCQGLEIPNPSDEELAFWKNVWNEWNAMNNKKPKTENQIRKWLAHPYSEAAEYSLWGNGIALVSGFFVLQGIVRGYEDFNSR